MAAAAIAQPGEKRRRPARRTARSQREGSLRPVENPQPETARRGTRRSSEKQAPARHTTPATPATAAKARQPRKATKPALSLAIAACAELEALRALSSRQARDHVRAYLHGVMPDDLADAFEAEVFQWELHVVDLDQIQLVRGVDLDRKKVTRYRNTIRRGHPFPPLIGLGGDSTPTRDVLLCDGYHRAVAMRDAGFHAVWMWLAVSPWREDALTGEEMAG